MMSTLDDLKKSVETLIETEKEVNEPDFMKMFRKEKEAKEKKKEEEKQARYEQYGVQPTPEQEFQQFKDYYTNNLIKKMGKTNMDFGMEIIKAH